MNIDKDTQKNNLKFVTYGSPIMDLIVDADDKFVKDHNLKLDSTSHANENDEIFTAISKMNPIKVAGGCSYNAIRIINWFLKDTKYTNQTGCIGSIGNDEFGKEYTNLLLKENINPLFEIIEGLPTGYCATICDGRERCHRTNLGASTKISEKFVETNWDKFKDLKLLYTELYILSHREKTLFDLGKLCLDNDKIFGFNLPSIGFLQGFSEKIKDIIEYGDILFANKEEAKFFVEKILNEKYDNIHELVEILARLPKKNKNKKRVFVVTCGPDPLHVAVFNHNTNKLEYSESFKPCYIPQDQIIDVNGAGDSFAGGFLAYYMQGYDFDLCVGAGNWAAKQIIKVRGVNIPFDLKIPDKESLIIK